MECDNSDEHYICSTNSNYKKSTAHTLVKFHQKTKEEGKKINTLQEATSRKKRGKVKKKRKQNFFRKVSAVSAIALATSKVAWHLKFWQVSTDWVQMRKKYKRNTKLLPWYRRERFLVVEVVSSTHIARCCTPSRHDEIIESEKLSFFCVKLQSEYFKFPDYTSSYFKWL